MEMQKEPFSVPKQTEPIWVVAIDEIRGPFNARVMWLQSYSMQHSFSFKLIQNMT